jgi:hypothetical protein
MTKGAARERVVSVAKKEGKVAAVARADTLLAGK